MASAGLSQKVAVGNGCGANDAVEERQVEEEEEEAEEEEAEEKAEDDGFGRMLSQLSAR